MAGSEKDGFGGDLTKPITTVVDSVVESFEQDGGREVAGATFGFLRKGVDILHIPLDIILAGRRGVEYLAQKLRRIPLDQRQTVPPQLAGPALDF